MKTIDRGAQRQAQGFQLPLAQLGDIFQRLLLASEHLKGMVEKPPACVGQAQFLTATNEAGTQLALQARYRLANCRLAYGQGFCGPAKATFFNHRTKGS